MTSGATGNTHAVVVGLCAHGLAIARNLADHGVAVHAVEANAALPGTRTRMATTHLVGDINSASLIDHLLVVRRRIASSDKPVLFLSNDNMVRCVAENWPRLSDDYSLSWSQSCGTIKHLLSKSALQARCERVGLNYPRSLVINSLEDLSALREGFDFPLVIKPVTPLGAFKVRRFERLSDLREFVREVETSVPLLVQQWIDGSDETLLFCALLLHEGEALARFEGRKLASFPPALGQTLAAEPCPANDVFEVTRRFFDGLKLSGPVSLEVKRDKNGKLWVIEPTVGRTDYWVPVCIGNGIELPYLEYSAVLGMPRAAPVAGRTRCWYDTEKDPLCYLRLMLQRQCSTWRALFPYLRFGDVGPFVRAARLMLGKVRSSFERRIRRRLMYPVKAAEKLP
jgi:predicted ATP-grasp superfamily ATP-dependent carboligase